MLTVSNLTKTYGPQTLFEGASFVVNPGERVGLVGRNGHGKSTLIRLILGEEEKDSGDIFLSKGYTLGHLSQHLSFSEPTILDECVLALPLLDGCWKETYKAEELLHGLGFTDADFTRAPSEFSGGYQIRLNLVKLLLSEPNLLLLDEPTNYLDIVSVRWLQRFLKDFQGEVLLVTHDRHFMDSVTTHTLGIHRGKVKKVEGSTEKLYSIIAEEEELYEKTRVGEEKKRREVEKFVERFRAKASKAKAVQSRVKLLEKIEVKAELANIQDLEFSFSYANFPGKWPMNAEDIYFGYEGGESLINGISLSVGKNDRIGVIGPNGKGKTTFLNLLAGELTPTNGSVSYNDNTKIAYFGQTNIQRLNFDKTIEEEIGEIDRLKSRTAVRGICGAMMFEGDAALKKISVLSGGEKSRVLLGKLLVTPSNLLLLDEPTNHLDMYSIEALVDAIEAYEGAVIMVTHSEMILERLATRLVVFDRGKVEAFEGGYEDFLSSKGWQDEDSNAEVQRSTKKANYEEEKKSVRKQDNDQRKLEQNILSLEEEVEGLESELIKASEDREVKKIADLSKKISSKKEELVTLYEILG